MRTLKAGEDIDFLKMEYIFFLLLHRDVSPHGSFFFIGDGIHMPFFLHLFRIHSEGAYIQSII